METEADAALAVLWRDVLWYLTAIIGVHTVSGNGGVSRASPAAQGSALVLPGGLRTI
jgi:hypothetical protein